MAESPTRDDVLTERPDIETILDDNEANLDIDDYIAKALEKVQRDLRERKSIQWAMVYDSVTDDYFTDTAGNENNKDSIQNMIVFKTVEIVFKDFSIKVNDSAWWDLYLAYRADYDEFMQQAKLDIDRDESGSITEGEEKTTTQTFFKV